ncbi:SHOCT domain-containing protein [Bacillus oleronius]|nr:SHOCT domain-containing protein [Heyndrickxia oleronia]
MCDQQEALERGKSNNTESSVDEILKFKQLLDQGIITQEEFDAKKKNIIRFIKLPT